MIGAEKWIELIKEYSVPKELTAPLLLSLIHILTMYSQALFLPSIMLSGIMFSTKLLPNTLETIGFLFPATWGYRLLTQSNPSISSYFPLCIFFFVALFISIGFLKKIKSE